MFKYEYYNNKHIYDGISEFCMCERVNEEYTRALLLEEKFKTFINKIVTLKTMVLVLIK